MTLPICTLALLLYAGFRGPWLWRLLALLTLAPLLRYADSVFGFAIRLQLSAWAGTLLQAAGFAVTVEGNVLILNGQPMSVDPACMGLRMMGFTLLVAVFWLIYFEKQHARQVRMRWVLGYGFVALGLTVLSNLLRIVVLVWFGIVPAHPLHEGIGLVCVVVYAWLPLMALANQLAQRTSLPAHNGPMASTPGTLWAIAYQPVRQHWDKVLLVSVLLVAFTRPSERTYPTTTRAGYVQRATTFGFTQYSRPGELIYIKPLPDWYSAEHSPAICWKGQGYTLRRIREATIAGQPVYLADLQKGTHRLQTAWWFSNGRQRSTSQLDVRTRMLRSEPGFALINVTVSEPETLERAVKAWQ